MTGLILWLCECSRCSSFWSQRPKNLIDSEREHSEHEVTFDLNGSSDKNKSSAELVL